MSDATWERVEDYYDDVFVKTDGVLAAALEESRKAGLPEIQVSAAQGKFLMMLAGIMGAKRILEIGTLGGFSTIWMARGMAAGGKMISLEYVAKHAEVARENIARAGLSEVVEVRVGRAIETLPTLVGEGPFDLVFIDADKASTADYFSWAMKLTRSGSVIVVDNVVRKGEIMNEKSTDEGVAGIRRFNELARNDARVDATVLQTVSAKGYDGFAILRVV